MQCISVDIGCSASWRCQYIGYVNSLKRVAHHFEGNMVMMQSSVSDIPQPASPHSPTPNSPNNSNKNNNVVESPFPKFETIRLERPQATKFDGILLARFAEQDSDAEVKNRPLIYPKDLSELESNSKFAIERLKQLTNNSMNRSSPSDDSNQSVKYTHENKLNNLSPQKSVEIDTSASNPHHINNQLAYHQFPIKYPTNPVDMDIERLKLARSMTNGKELSDFGFRIQLGGFQSNYAHSDTSEELVVDENNDMSSQEQDPTTVSEFQLKCN